MRKRKSALLGTAITAAGFALAPALVIGAPSAVAGPTACKPTVSSAAIRFCGPATARLSIFPGVTFRNGTCLLKAVNPGGPTLDLKLGTRSMKNPFQVGGTNGGLPYFALAVDGPLSSPAGGGVIAFYKGKHWYGRGVSFRGNARGGTFVAQGIPERGSHGTATGSFHC